MSNRQQKPENHSNTLDFYATSSFHWVAVTTWAVCPFVYYHNLLQWFACVHRVFTSCIFCIPIRTTLYLQKMCNQMWPNLHKVNTHTQHSCTNFLHQNWNKWYNQWLNEHRKFIKWKQNKTAKRSQIENFRIFIEMRLELVKSLLCSSFSFRTAPATAATTTTTTTKIIIIKKNWFAQPKLFNTLRDGSCRIISSLYISHTHSLSLSNSLAHTCTHTHTLSLSLIYIFIYSLTHSLFLFLCACVHVFVAIYFTNIHISTESKKIKWLDFFTLFWFFEGLQKNSHIKLNYFSSSNLVRQLVVKILTEIQAKLYERFED